MIKRNTKLKTESKLEFDQILTWQIIQNELISIPNQIDKNITRTAFSPLINEYKDYAVGIVDVQGKLISQSRGSLLIFAANALGTAVQDGLDIFGEECLKEGDVIISNHAGTLGQHLNNVVMYTPIRVGNNGRLIGFFCVLMHWIDVGGSMVGSCSSTETTEIYQEGIQFRSVKLLSEGSRNSDIFRMIEYNTRFPEMLLGDVESQLSACLKGRNLVIELANRYQAEDIIMAVNDMWDRAQESAKRAIQEAPDGIYRASSFLDGGEGRHVGEIPVSVEVIIKGDVITVDFSEVSPQIDGPLNAGRNGGAVAAARIAVKFLFSPEIPVNEGDFRQLEIKVPDGTFISASPTAPIGSSGHMIPTVVDTVLKALQPAFPDRVAAAHHGTYGVHAFHGYNPFTKSNFYHLDTSSGGWGATRSHDGYGPSRSIVHGDTSDVPIELQEAIYPYQFESYVIRQDSGGAGRRRGGLGVVKTYRINSDCGVNLKIDRTKCPPWGVAGGRPGLVGTATITRKDGVKSYVIKGDQKLYKGDQVSIYTAGGGGNGSALGREIDLVIADLECRYISTQAAKEDYGIVFRGDGAVDEILTDQNRKHLSKDCGGN